MTPKGSLPTGRLRRALDLARVGARTGTALLVGRGTDGAAEQALELLGNLRGLAAKLGQTLSYVDGLVPERHRESFEKTLGRLQSATTTSSSEEIAQVVAAELGRPPRELFAEWTDEPVASASIGQVHRARLPDGGPVAVKVQHPHIDEALEQDLQNVSLIEGLLDLVGPRGLDAEPLVEEVLGRFRDELDYTLEAAHQTAFRAFHACDPTVRIPEVIAERSSRRVLTSAWVDGSSLDEARRAPPELRRAYAETLWRFVFRGNLVGGRFNADPHPGNYLFHPDGGVTFLDFGCIQPIEERLRRAAIDVHQGALDGDEAAFRQAVASMLGTRGGRYERASQDFVRRCFEPLFASPFRLDHRYAAELFDAAKDLKKSMFARDGSFTTPPRHLALMNRLQFGFYSVLARLDVRVDYRDVERAFLDEARQRDTGAIRLPSARTSEFDPVE